MSNTFQQCPQWLKLQWEAASLLPPQASCVLTGPLIRNDLEYSLALAALRCLHCQLGTRLHNLKQRCLSQL